MTSYFKDHKPDLVIMSADWLEYKRSSPEAMIADIRTTISSLNASGVRVALIGPNVQVRSRLPSMLARARLRGVEARSEDVLLPDVFTFDTVMRTALPDTQDFHYVSVANAVCPARQCPLTVDDGVPLAFDHAHLTAEGSAYVAARLVPLLGLK